MTFTTTVSNPAIRDPYADGSVIFYDGALLGTGSLDGGGVAPQLSRWYPSIIALYSGDTYDTGSTSNTVSQVVARTARPPRALHVAQSVGLR